MVIDYKMPKLLYLDTNILSNLAKESEKNLRKPLTNFILDSELFIGISDSILVELSQAESIHLTLSQILCCIPSCLLFNSKKLLKQEFNSYPNHSIISITDFYFTK